MTNAVKKIVRGFFGKTEISIDGLMEIFEQTGNADVALDILLGTYEQPEIPQQAQKWGRQCTFKSFNKWTNKVLYTYVDTRREHIHIRKGINAKTLTPDNYKEHIVQYNEPDAQYAYVAVEANALHEDTCSLPDWLEGNKELDKTTPEL